jgi:hypothetical protein
MVRVYWVCNFVGTGNASFSAYKSTVIGGDTVVSSMQHYLYLQSSLIGALLIPSVNTKDRAAAHSPS